MAAEPAVRPRCVVGDGPDIVIEGHHMMRAVTSRLPPPYCGLEWRTASLPSRQPISARRKDFSTSSKPLTSSAGRFALSNERASRTGIGRLPRSARYQIASLPSKRVNTLSLRNSELPTDAAR